MFKSGVVVVAVLLLAACGAPKPRQEPAHPSLPASPGAGTVPRPPAADDVDTMPGRPTGPGIYVIDPEQSELRLLVYRAGAMARLGHNHVITNRAVAGWIKFGGDPAAAAVALSVPVEGFVVDNDAARAAEGEDFVEEVSEEAKGGTRHNMLSAALLDVEHHANITLVSQTFRPGAAAMTATLQLRIAGHQSTLVVPFEVATSKTRISASGAVKLRQTELGLRPFSIMMGALQVQDEFTVKFTLVAMATQ